MSKRILIGCYEVPGWGGASTSRYKLFQRMQRDGLDVLWVNLVHAADALYFRYVYGERFGNPWSLDGVHTCVLEPPLWRPHRSVVDVLESHAPDLLVGCGAMATLLLREAAPRLPLVLMTIGSYQMQSLIETGAVRDYMQFERNAERGFGYPVLGEGLEGRAMEASDLVIVNSPLVRRVLEYFFPRRAGKIYANVISVADFIYPEGEAFAHLRRPWDQRDADVVFIASDWQRPVKNQRLMAAIAARCADLRVHVAGEAAPSRLPATRHDLITSREELYALLGRARTVVCPSLFDAAPGVLFEASAMGCNVVASPNCGNWELCHPDLLARRCSVESFVQSIRLSVTQPHADSEQRFRGGYEDLVRTLEAF